MPVSRASLYIASGRGWSPAEWGLRWLYDQPEVTVVLSGMNSLEMVEENCRIASVTQPDRLTEQDFAILEKVKKRIREKVGCTGCRCCMPCPKGVDIPEIFRCYSAMFIESRQVGAFSICPDNRAYKGACICLPVRRLREM